MKKFITIPMVTYKEESLGLPEERVQVNAKVDSDKIIAYREAVAEDEDEVAIVVYCTGDFAFYSPISIKEFEKRMNSQPEDYGMTSTVLNIPRY
jgi:hypothetical protein